MLGTNFSDDASEIMSRSFAAGFSMVSQMSNGLKSSCAWQTVLSAILPGRRD